MKVDELARRLHASADSARLQPAPDADFRRHLTRTRHRQRLVRGGLVGVGALACVGVVAYAGLAVTQDTSSDRDPTSPTTAVDSMPDCALSTDADGFGPGGRPRAGFSILLVNDGETCHLDTAELGSELVGSRELEVRYSLDDKPRVVTLKKGEYLGLEYWWRNWCGPKETAAIRISYRDATDVLVNVRQKSPSCTDAQRPSTLSLWDADQAEVLDAP